MHALTMPCTSSGSIIVHIHPMDRSYSSSVNAARIVSTKSGWGIKPGSSSLRLETTVTWVVCPTVLTFHSLYVPVNGILCPSLDIIIHLWDTTNLIRPSAFSLLLAAACLPVKGLSETRVGKNHNHSANLHVQSLSVLASRSNFDHVKNNFPKICTTLYPPFFKNRYHHWPELLERKLPDAIEQFLPTHVLPAHSRCGWRMSFCVKSSASRTRHTPRVNNASPSPKFVPASNQN